MFGRYRDKRTRLRSAHELLALGRRLMQTAAADDEPLPSPYASAPVFTATGS